MSAKKDEDFAHFVFEDSGTRMVGDGVTYPDYLTLRRRVEDWSQWFDGWAEVARDYEERAKEALTRGFTVSRGELYFQASITWQYAQFLWFHRPEEREEGQRRKVATYREGAPHFRPAAERVDIEFDGTKIPAYFRVPEGEANTPCVVLIGGLESTKEEYYLFENMLLRRGMATIAFDGPGQGEYFFERPMVPDFERYTSAVVDYLETRPEVNAARLGVIGRSLGGYYAARSAAFERRFRAAVAWGAMFDLSYFDEMEPLTQHGLRYVTGVEGDDEAERAARRMIDLSDAAELIEVPLYILHGEKDGLIPVSQAHLLDERTPNAKKTVVIEPEGNHCGHNIHHKVRPAMADWMAEQLEASGHRAGAGS